MTATWIFMVILAVALGAYWLRRRGYLTWLSKVQLPGLAQPSIDNRVTKINSRTEKEKEAQVELLKLLEAKKTLVETQAENTRIRKEIATINPKSINKPEAKEKPNIITR